VDTREWTPSTSNVIKFVRKVNAEWDEQGGYFRPTDKEYPQDEEWMIQWLKADDFVEKACFDRTGMALKMHIQRVKNVASGKRLIIVLEGLAKIFANAKNARNRQHDAAVRGQSGENSRANKNDRWLELNPDDVENALIEMQLAHEMRIVQTSGSDDSAEWISILAADIASIPYKYSPY